MCESVSPKLNDLVRITMIDQETNLDGEVRMGVVQGTYDNGGIFIYHPKHGNMFYGVHKKDLKAEGAIVEVIPDELADFRLDLYRSGAHGRGGL